MYVHMDGARVANAAASLDVGLRETTADVGVDVMSFGGTKNGLLGGEAVVFFRPELADQAAFIRKQHMQLASKMRFVSAQFVALLEKDLWLRNASHSNAMAQRLCTAVTDVPDVEITRSVDANAVFAILPPAAVPELQAAYPFYIWDAATNEVRWMCSWDTTEDDVDQFAKLVAEIVPASAR
jgi:threonine aldolase